MKEKSKKAGKIIMISVIILLVLLILSVGFALVNMNHEKIVQGVMINGVDVSNYTREELLQKYQEKIKKNQAKVIELKYREQEIDITPEGIGTTYNMEQAIEEAYMIGRKENIFINNFEILRSLVFQKNIDLRGTPDEKLLEETVQTINSNLEGAVEEASYYIEEDKLIITQGKRGVTIQVEKLKQMINEQVNDFTTEVSVIEIPVTEIEPHPIDLAKIHSEIYSEPQDAYISEDPLTVHPHVNGVDFAISVEEAQELLTGEQEEYEIPLKITIANKTLSDLGKEAFPNQLGTFSTKFATNNTARSNNIKLATNKINGMIILPGETFSYNKTVGKRTIEAGFQEAGAYSAGKVVQEVGGGICQVSSTLYNAAVYANLEIVERHNHTFESSYVAPSRDATVSWGGPDFKFKNNRKYPIKIEASSKNGTEVVSIYGIKEDNEYEVIIQSRVLSTIERKTEYVNDNTLLAGEEVIVENGHDGCTSEAYKILRKDGQTVETVLMSKDTYNALARTIRRGTKSVQKEIIVQETIPTSVPETPTETENKVENTIETTTPMKNTTSSANTAVNTTSATKNTEVNQMIE